MAKLIVPTEQVGEAQGNIEGGVNSVIPMSRNKPGNALTSLGEGLGSTMEQAGQSVNSSLDQYARGISSTAGAAASASAQAGSKMIQQGQEYFRAAQGAMEDTVFNSAYSQASVEYNQAVQTRMAQTTDDKGNPNFLSMQGDIQQIGDQINQKYASKMLTPELQSRFADSMSRLQLSKQLQGMGAARQQQLGFAVSSLNQITDTATDNALKDSPENTGHYYATGAQAIDNALKNGYIDPEQALNYKDKLRRDMYVGQLNVLNGSNPQALKQELATKSNDQLNITQAERLDLNSQNQAALQAQAKRQAQQVKEQQKLIKDQQSFNSYGLDIGITQGKANQADIQDAYSKGKISIGQYDKLLKAYNSANGITAKQTNTMTSIAGDIQSGGDLSKYSSSDVDKYYQQQVQQGSKSGQPMDLLSKASIASSMNVPVSSFKKDIKFNLSANDPKQVMNAVDAYNYAKAKNPNSVAGLDKNSVGMLSYLSAYKNLTNADPAQIVNRAKQALNVTPEESKLREQKFAQDFGIAGRDLSASDKTKNFENSIKNIYGLGNHFFGPNDTVSQDVKNQVFPLLHDAYKVTGDKAAAEEMVKNETKGLIGTTSMNGAGKQLMTYPPESVYNTDAHNHLTPEEMRNDINTDPNIAAAAKAAGISSKDLHVSSDYVTQAEYQNKNGPSYHLTYTTKEGEEVPLQNPNGTTARWRPDEKGILQNRVNQDLQQAQSISQQKNASDTQERDAFRIFNPGSIIPPGQEHTNGTIDTLKQGISSVETPGSKEPYKALGPVTSSGDRAYGKYQVMGANIPAWSKEALGYSISPQEFLERPDLQEKIVDNKLGQYVDQYHNVDDVLSTWHSGRPLAQASAAGANDGNMYTTQYVQQAKNYINTLPNEQERHETADTGNTLAPRGLDTLMGNVTAVPQIAEQIDSNIGSNLYNYTESKIGTRYDFGSKSTSSGGIDCSGWVAENTLHAMESINQQKGPIYDMDTMKQLLGAGGDGVHAADQIAHVAKLTGYLPATDVRSGQVPNGTLIGIQRANPPSYARTLPNQVSHIVQVVVQNGQKYVSQSAGSVGGVNLTPYDQWLARDDIKSSKLYAVNPFNIVSSEHLANDAHRTPPTQLASNDTQGDNQQ
jgi:hypothetical protein